MSAPAVLVDVDRAVRCGAATTRLRARYVVLGTDTVHAVVTTDCRVECRRLTARDWRRDLDLLARVPGCADPSTPTVEELRLPWDLVVGTGLALGEHRPDLYDELVARAEPTGPPGPPGPPGQPLGSHLRRLHDETAGRLRVVGILPGRRLGWVSWVLVSDGWRALTPYLEHRPAPRQMVRVEPRRPEDLPLEVARWAAAADR